MTTVLATEEDPRFRMYTASANQQLFAVPFPFQQDEDLAFLVRLDSGAWLEIAQSQYSVAGAGDPAGGSILLAAGRAEGDEVLVLGRTVLDRIASIVRDGRYNSKLTDDEFDRGRLIDQEQARDLLRAVKVDFGQDELILPLSDGSSLLGWGPDNKIRNRPEVSESTNAAEAAAEAAIGAAHGQMIFPDRYALALAAVPLFTKGVQLLGFEELGDGQGGLWVDEADYSVGDIINSGGVTSRPFYRANDIGKKRFTQDVVRYIDGPKLPKKEKWIISSDWQPVNTEPSQIAYLRTVLDSFKTYHSDAAYVICPGDLVDAASANTTGAAPTYGYPQLRADFEARTGLSWERFLALPGNHDRDGVPAGSFEQFWSYTTYRDSVGPEFYSMTRGNIALLFAGDMAGSNSGEIITYALEWLDRELKRLKGYNCIIFFHQPIYGVHPTGTGEDSTWVQYNGGTRIAPILQKYKSQIVFVGYGHVGRSYASGVNVTDLNGIRWINFSLAIPGLFNSGWVDHGVYSTLEVTDKATSLTLKRWDVENHAYNPAYDVPLAVPYPISLGNNFWDWDGRKGVHPQNGVFRDPVTIYMSQAQWRENVGGTWGAKAEPTPMLRLILGDDSAEANKTGTGPALVFGVPGVSTKNDVDGFPVSASPNGYAISGMIAALNTVNTPDVHETRLSFRVMDTSDILREVLDLAPLTLTNKSGLNMKANYPIRMDDNLVLDANRLLNMTPMTVAQLNALSLTEVKIAYCSNGNAGAPCLAVSKGAGGGWARIALGANISAT